MSLVLTSYTCLESDSLTRKCARSGQKGDAVDKFRGVSFDDWLRLIMQVSRSIFGGCICIIVDWKRSNVLFLRNEINMKLPMRFFVISWYLMPIRRGNDKIPSARRQSVSIS